MLTALTSALYIIGNVLIAGVVARRGVEFFGTYNLARRIGTGVMPFVCLGMNVGLVKYLAPASAAVRIRVLVAALKVFIAILAVGVLAAFVVGQILPRIVNEPFDLLNYYGTVLYIFAVAANSFVYATYRGFVRQDRANVLTLAGMTILPLMVATVTPHGWDVGRLLIASSLLTLVWVTANLAIHEGTRIMGAWRSVRASESSAMMAYSLPRVPAATAMGMMMVVGPWIATARGASESASYLLAGLAFIQVVAAAVGALGIVMLPRVAMLADSSDAVALSRLVTRVLYFNLAVAALATPVLIAVCPTAVRLWLGTGFAGAYPVVEVVACAVPGILAYTVLAAIADGALRRAVTTYAALAGLSVCAALSWTIGDTELGLALSFALGQSIAALILMYAVSRAVPISLEWRRLALILVGSSLAAVLVRAVSAAGMNDTLLLALTFLLSLAGLFAVTWFSPEEYGLRQALMRIGQDGGRSE